MRRSHTVLALTLTTWTLLYSRHGTMWRPLEDFTSGSTCRRVRSAWVEVEATKEIGSVLASQPADNPLRDRAIGRAREQVGARFRCVDSRRSRR